MAIYSFSVGVISRSNNHHATAAAAYRSASLIHDEKTGTMHDYTRKRGVLHSEILTPEDAPAWMHDRAQLWNAVERQEGRVNSQLARDIVMALPHELSFEQQRDLVRGFCREEFAAHGMVADLSSHAPSREGDERNVHAHVMLTMRHIDGDHFSKHKARDWNGDAMLAHWREAWAEHCNTALEDAGFDDVRVDHRSLEAQGIDRVPGEHQGKSTTAQERRGISTERGGRQRDTEETNRELDRLVAELAELDAKIAALEERRLDAAYGTAAPEIDDAAARDLAGRFGDELPSRLTPEALGEREGLTPEPESTAAAGEPRRISAWGDAWRVFADRAARVAGQIYELWKDESGTKADPSLEPGAHSRGWVSRVVEAGHHLLHGWRHREFEELAEGVAEAAALVHDLTRPEPPPTESGGDLARPVGDVEPIAPDAAPQEKPEPGTAAPVTNIGAAYEEALWRNQRQAPDEPGWPDANAPEPDAPEPEPYGPEPG